ncbi:protein of unknown function [Shewanella benthica]|uniref:Uncharacterized protein n=1 Tax=Shewanella benthica TaxID=43661 RepID=A0A330M1Y9_9GAMM|nr:protein of unknown function [Shewanella benthica]
MIRLEGGQWIIGITLYRFNAHINITAGSGPRFRSIDKVYF